MKSREYKMWRVSHGFTLQAIADEIKSTPSTISRFENGVVNTTVDLIDKYNKFIEDHADEYLI